MPEILTVDARRPQALTQHIGRLGTGAIRGVLIDGVFVLRFVHLSKG
jgi:hypothetical protein